MKKGNGKSKDDVKSDDAFETSMKQCDFFQASTIIHDEIQHSRKKRTKNLWRNLHRAARIAAGLAKNQGALKQYLQLARLDAGVDQYSDRWSLIGLSLNGIFRPKNKRARNNVNKYRRALLELHDQDVALRDLVKELERQKIKGLIDAAAARKPKKAPKIRDRKVTVQIDKIKKVFTLDDLANLCNPKDRTAAITLVLKIATDARDYEFVACELYRWPMNAGSESQPKGDAAKKGAKTAKNKK